MWMIVYIFHTILIYIILGSAIIILRLSQRGLNVMTFLGATIDVALHWFIIAQVLGVITIIFDFISYQIRDQRKYLLVFSIGSFFWMLMFIAIGAEVSPILAAAFSVLRGMVFWWIFAKNTPKRKLGGRIFLYVALLIGLGGAVIGILNSQDYVVLQIVMLVTALLFVVGQYLPSKHYVRAFAILYAVSMLLISTPLGTFNPMGIFIEVAKIVSIIVFYIILARRSYFAMKLKQIKLVVNCEMDKVNSCSEVDAVADVMPKEKLERLVAKMVKYELATIDTSRLVDFQGVEGEIQAVLDDLKTVQDVKNVLQGAINIKDEKLEHMHPRGTNN